MRRDITTSLVAILVITVLFGIGYPLVVTGLAQGIFPERANGSRIERGGKLVGSRLLAQDFRRPVLDARGKPKLDASGKPVMAPDPHWFQPRPSTATSYDAAASAFTNLGPNASAARDTFVANLAAYLRLERPYDHGLTAAAVPIDAVTSSASGVDPQISPANARIQAHRIAAARGLSLAQVSALIAKHTDGRFLGVVGEPGVNVLELNLALANQHPTR
jgi:potassium-transporting ATPase KdpC subunit